MYPTDQSISSYGSNPNTPVNSPPPLTSQQQQAQQQQQQVQQSQQASQQSIHAAAVPASGGSTVVVPGGGVPASVASAATAAAVAAAGGAWQQINPAVINSNGGGPAVLNSLSNGSYAPELVHRGLPHMVNWIGSFTYTHTPVNEARCFFCFVLFYTSYFVFFLSLRLCGVLVVVSWCPFSR